jgi:hypothetical protein
VGFHAHWREFTDIDLTVLLNPFSVIPITDSESAYRMMLPRPPTRSHWHDDCYDLARDQVLFVKRRSVKKDSVLKRSIISIAASLSLLISVGTTQAGDHAGQTQINQAVAKFCKAQPSHPKCKGHVRAVPEIDAASGTQAIALVLGAVLLGAESLRRRRQRATG